MAALSFVDRDRQRFKASAGLTVRQTPRDIAFCSHVVYRGADVVVGDALADPLFQGNSLVIGAPHVRFYAGSPIRSSSGHPIGALCVLDTQARVLRAARDYLRHFAALVTDEVLARQFVGTTMSVGAHQSLSEG